MQIAANKAVSIEYTLTNADGEVLDSSDGGVDGNHPLVGEQLTFDVKVLEIREATEDEMAHGHIHGEGGVEH